ncbi:MAG: ferredoxin [Pyrinomonadaceae bacterium]|nr:ferredoxin [Pyrinomonadaceae bacterium]MCX7640007.1 ferredoxin [Pyrinomonadaceae bacterium]MDW8304179.1 ferredoxin [Acidobacteriota bacterium]
MANLQKRLPDNVAGKFYVDSTCIDCDVCRDTAPANFKRNDEHGYSYVYKQPENAEEVALCEEAMRACPVEAIGDNDLTLLRLQEKRKISCTKAQN